MAYEQHPHLDHLFKVGVLYNRANNPDMPEPVRLEAQEELDRYRLEGQALLQQRRENKTMAKKSKKPQPADESSDHTTRMYGGRGVLFCVADDRESMGIGATTIDVITAAIEDALDNGNEDSESIAKWITTSSFSYEPDKRVRFNSLLKAGDSIGAQMTRKIYNAYNELAEIANEPDLSPTDKRIAKAEATGFAQAAAIMFSPFSCEDESDPRLVNWDMVDHVTSLFEKEQILVRRARNGNPQ